MELAKIHVKVRRDKTIDWAHFCYVPRDIKDKFDTYANTVRLSSNQWIFKWAVEDFGNIKLNNWDELETLKGMIRELYKQRYPKIYFDSNTDKQGWIRAWYTEHMERELKNVGK